MSLAPVTELKPIVHSESRFQVLDGGQLESPEPTALDRWRQERRQSPAPVASGDWRAALPPELLERLRDRSAPAARPQELAAMTPSEAGSAPLPASYRAPYLPVEPAPVEVIGLKPAFQGIEWGSEDAGNRVLVSIRPVLDVALANEVIRLLHSAPGMTKVRPLGATDDIAAFEAEYEGPLPGWVAVSQALKGIGASLVSSGDHEFYLAIQGQRVS